MARLQKLDDFGDEMPGGSGSGGSTLGDQTPEAQEAELAALLDRTIEAHKVAFNALVDAKAKHNAQMSPQSKAALGVMGRGAASDESKLRDLKFEIEKRLAVVRAEKSRGVAKRGRNVASEDLRVLREHAAAVVRGHVKLDEKDRRRLGHALSVAELLVAESA